MWLLLGTQIPNDLSDARTQHVKGSEYRTIPVWSAEEIEELCPSAPADDDEEKDEK